MSLIFHDFTVRLIGETAPLVRLDAAIEGGACLALMGASGIGKSSILSAVAGFPTPHCAVSGGLSLNGRRLDGLAPERRRIGILFQDDLLLPHLDVGDNLLFAMPRGAPLAQRRAAMEEALASAGLAGLSARMPQALSGGQRSRVALLRCLLNEPEALLLDEAFSKLDRSRREAMRALTLAECRRRRLPVMMATHDPTDAEAFGAEILDLDAGRG